MKWVFWGAAGLIAYTYLGYAGWLWLRSRWRPRPVRLGTFTPFISIVMIVRNEAAVLSGKMRNLMELNYPENLCEIVVVSDGSTDDTNQILSHHAQDPRVRVILNSKPGGKAAGLNDAIQSARGEIVVFTDARQKIEPDAVRLLLQNFADPNVGCASGELMLGDPTRWSIQRDRIVLENREKNPRVGIGLGFCGGSHRRALCRAPRPAGCSATGNDFGRCVYSAARSSTGDTSCI